MKASTTEDVVYLLESYIVSAALGAAIEHGLFWLMEEQPMDALKVAQVLEIPINRCRRWLRLLSNAALLEQTARGYKPSPVTQNAILDAYSRETWDFIAREFRQRAPATRDLALHIQEPGSVWTAQGLEPPDYFAQIVESPKSARLFTRALYEIHLSLADSLAESLDMTGVERLMDLGGGSGVTSFALLRRCPLLSAVVIDIPNVCAAGREIARENSLDDRISYFAADYLQDELPSGFDMVLLCDSGPYTETLFRKIRALLNPGGRIVVVEQLALAEGAAPEAFANWAFLSSLHDPASKWTTTAEVEDALTRAGFHLLSSSSLQTTGMLHWLGRWEVIEARK